MIEILSWNIQNGIGTDGTLSLQRIASVIKDMGSPHVICLQEVSRNLPLQENAVRYDQVEELSELFPDYEVIYGVAIDAFQTADASRWQYGNAILTRLPILSVFKHVLPQTAADGIRHMMRQATEITLQTELGALRVITTHLEYHSRLQRDAQINRILELHTEAVDNNKYPAKADLQGPYQKVTRATNCVFCGDFNIEPDTEEYTQLAATLAKSGAPMTDIWKTLYKGAEHLPTCGVYDHISWPQGPHCRDYFFVTKEIAASASKVIVNTQTDASDHQPILLHLQG